MAEPTTRLQVSGHRFLMRRMEHALVRGDTRMLDDPIRGQSLSLTGGAVLAVLAVVVAGILAVVRPGGALGDASVVVVRETGAMYVRIDDVLHPVPNLASARLIAGAAVEPKLVSTAAVEQEPQGPAVGIPAAPQHISEPLAADESGWTVCESAGATTVIAGRPDRGTTGSVLVTPVGDSAAVTYLLHGGWRSRVDLRHPAVVRALRLDGVVPRPVSPALLAVVPEAPAISPPHIAALGAPGPVRGHPIGSVLTVRRAGDAAADFYVVLGEGVQRIGEVAADLIRYTDARTGDDMPSVPADVIGAVPVVTSLPVSTFPEDGGVVSGAVLCAAWRHTDDETGSRTEVFVGESVPDRSITLAQADDDGPAVDALRVPTGRSMFVRSVGLTGGGRSAGPLFWVSEFGVRYGVHDADSAVALGLSGSAVPAPWAILASLPAGPELSREAASTMRDGVGAAVPSPRRSQQSPPGR